MKIKDPFQEWRDREDTLILVVPVTEGLEETIAARMDGRRFATFTIAKAVASLGSIEVAFLPKDRQTLENFSAGKNSDRWPVDLILQVQTMVRAASTARDEQAEERRKERDREIFARDHEELQRRGVLFPDGDARREQMRRVN